MSEPVACCGHDVTEATWYCRNELACSGHTCPCACHSLPPYPRNEKLAALIAAGRKLEALVRPTEELDPGIAKLVAFLRDEGFNTTDSGDGVSKEPGEGISPFPHVAITAPPFRLVIDALRLAAAVRRFGIAVEPQGTPGEWYIQATFDPANRSALLFLAKDPR